MRTIFCRLLSLNPGEERKVLIFALLGLLRAVAGYAGLKYADALFLIHVGADSLPQVYTYISCGMIVLSALFLYGYHRVDGDRIFKTLSIIGILFYAFIYFTFDTELAINGVWFWYMLRTGAALIFYTLITSFWLFIDQFHSGPDARRLFGLYNSMIFLGATATGLIMRVGWIDIQQLFLCIVMALMGVVFWIEAIKKLERPIVQTFVEARSTPLLEKIKSVLSSKYTLLVIGGNFCAFLMWVITEYNYLSAFENRFVTGEEVIGTEAQLELTRFLGKCFSFVSIANVIFGVFFWGRMIRRFGIGSVIFFTPLMYLLTFSGWLINGAFLFPMMGYFIVEGSAEIMDDSNFSVLVNATPTPIKSTTRVMIESIFEPLGMLTSGMLLTFSGLDSKVLGMVIACFAILIAISLRKHFSSYSYT